MLQNNGVQGKSSMSRAASNLQIDSARLWDTIHATAKFGSTPKGGVRRLTRTLGARGTLSSTALWGKGARPEAPSGWLWR